MGNDENDAAEAVDKASEAEVVAALHPEAVAALVADGVALGTAPLADRVAAGEDLVARVLGFLHHLFPGHAGLPPLPDKPAG